VSAPRGASPTASRRAWLSLILVAAIGAALYVGLPQIAGLDETWGRLSEGDPWWLAAALLFELGSYAGYVVLFRGVFAGADPPVGWRDSYDITMAGVAATRLLATAGLGGIALTGWALSRSGMARRELVSGLTTFYVALYGVFMLALVLVGGRAAHRTPPRSRAVRRDRGTRGIRRGGDRRRARHRAAPAGPRAARAGAPAGP
jgi:uncharacterized membrane protein YbhN (UPF0104 family)